MFSPPEMLMRAFWMASLMTTLPDVLAVMARPSRMATPLEMSVPSVRVKRAMDILRLRVPKMGIEIFIVSMIFLPPTDLAKRL